ncbi:MAG: hypothetical protein EHM43_10355 [Ignavibacteriae bacterium]|nr:MAG: hypothetical protein EHM43_10355 [Ignavibacteriota bacterium]
MELLIAILVYFGIVSPDATATMSQAERDYLLMQNQTLIQQTMKDPATIEAASTSGIIIDRLED